MYYYQFQILGQKKNETKDSTYARMIWHKTVDKFVYGFSGAEKPKVVLNSSGVDTEIITYTFASNECKDNSDLTYNSTVTLLTTPDIKISSLKANTTVYQ